MIRTINHQQKDAINGVTLLELISTVTILTILTTLALPQFNYLQARSESNHVYPYLNAIIQQHKEHAILKKQNILLCSSSNHQTCNNENIWNQGILAIYDRNNNNKFDSADTVIKFYSNKINHGTLTWNGGVTSPKLIILQSDTGLPRGSIGNFTYCSYKYSADLSHKSSLGIMGHLRYEKINNC